VASARQGHADALRQSTLTGPFLPWLSSGVRPIFDHAADWSLDECQFQNSL
jgi:hypothetical protein